MSLPYYSDTPLHKMFLEHAYGRMTWEEYIDNLLVFCIQRHDDATGRDLNNVQFADPLSYIIVSWCKKISPVEDSQPFKAVFKAYRQGTNGDHRYGTTGDVENKLDLLEESGLPVEGIAGVKKALAWRACHD